MVPDSTRALARKVGKLGWVEYGNRTNRTQ